MADARVQTGEGGGRGVYSEKSLLKSSSIDTETSAQAGLHWACFHKVLFLA